MGRCSCSYLRRSQFDASHFGVASACPTVGALFPDSQEAGRDVKQGWVLPSHMEMARLLACLAWLRALLQPWALPGGNHAELLGSWGLHAPFFLSGESVWGH